MTDPILIVDDQSAEAEALAELLSTMGYPTHIAHSVEDAWELLDTGMSLALIMLDIRMPGIDGIEFGLAVHHIYPRLPILYITGFALDDLEHEPGSAVLRKPITREALAGGMSRVLSAA